MKTFAITAVLSILAINTATAQTAIRVVGSSTVYPFTTSIAENFGKQTGLPIPIIESTGTGGGFKLFCSGTSATTPSVANASRAIKESEIKLCASAGVGEPIGLKIGKDAIVVANAKNGPTLDITKEQLFLALASRIPVNGKLEKNLYKKWSDIDPSLPNVAIEVLGPPPTSGTRDSFIELAMEPACHSLLKKQNMKLDDSELKKVCSELRQDGVYIDAGENDNLIVRKLVATPTAFGIFGFSFLEENLNSVKGGKIEGVAPTYETASTSQYALSRDLYIYIKREHLANRYPGLLEFSKEIVSERAIGDDGYLTTKGLVPLPKKDRDAQRNLIK